MKNPSENKNPRILDTSALVHDPKSLLSYKDDVYICLTVLEELDNLKERREKSVSADARVVIRMLEDIINGHSAEQMEKGIPLPSNESVKRGKLFIGIDTNLDVQSELKQGIGSDADNRIINYALHMQKVLGQEVTLVSRDINMRLKARTIGVDAEDVLVDHQISDIDLLYTGVQAFEGDLFDRVKSDDGFKLSGEVYQLDRNLFNEEVQYNMFWYDDAGHIGFVTEVTDEHVFTKLLPRKHNKIWGISPKNSRQAIAVSQLTDPHFDLNIILGPAGSGKTFLAVAAALHQVLELKQYKKIVVVRSRDFMDEDPGFLPGDLKEKSMPLLAGITDALISMHADDDHDANIHATVEHIIERANIEFTSMAYFRGRSIDDAVLIIDEAQNMTRAQMKGMLSRGGKNCRTILLGNLAQIDDKFVTPASSGATAAVNVYRNYDKGSVLIFDEVERSSLAQFTEQNL
ncbi:MAG: phosphate starvation-inducible protein PhoH [Alteromonadaceae bacterium]|uniref:PhoH-like ATPase n=2 Tax=Paraglaciecola TaxID=1621534 RepID=K6Y162_9ALTE|nr:MULTISPECIES: PhoH family protein [Paraglaciecola]MBN26834.1 phosphate starvation-inducible protein PhoH [Alteromonadaceae bacterium]GAC05669.1 PhoH-like ATPase [Paraglaciecola agarilytica NO2]GAC26579.1 PhoH-like ATPase [Paraglaciecola mesophila KMM 241]